MCQTLTKDKATRLNEVALRLIKSVQDVCENNRQVILHMAKEFSADYFVQLKHLKYHINVIEELHINENGHSRILCKLLQYTNGGHYVFLESFLDLIKTKNKKFTIKEVGQPDITQEKRRIDLWVRGNNYAIIFENKVCNAVDQDTQLQRYIEITAAEHYPLENIYIVYMPEYETEPADYSWGKYKDIFKDRYVCMPFNNIILKWLRNLLKSKIVDWEKEVELYTAIAQYKLYLEGLYYETAEYKEKQKMIHTLEQTIKGHLAPDFDRLTPIMQINILSTTISTLDEMSGTRDESLMEAINNDNHVLDALRERLVALKDDAYNRLFVEKREQLLRDYPDLKFRDEGYIYLSLPYKGEYGEFSLSLWPEKSNVYIYLSSANGIMGGDGDVFKFLKDKYKFSEKSNSWNYWYKVDFSDEKIEGELDKLKKILDEIMMVIN